MLPDRPWAFRPARSGQLADRYVLVTLRRQHPRDQPPTLVIALLGHRPAHDPTLARFLDGTGMRVAFFDMTIMNRVTQAATRFADFVSGQVQTTLALQTRVFMSADARLNTVLHDLGLANASMLSVQGVTYRLSKRLVTDIFLQTIIEMSPRPCLGTLHMLDGSVAPDITALSRSPGSTTAIRFKGQE